MANETIRVGVGVRLGFLTAGVALCHCDDVMPLWCCTAMSPCRHTAMALWRHAATAPWSHGVRRWCVTAVLPCRYGGVPLSRYGTVTLWGYYAHDDDAREVVHELGVPSVRHNTQQGRSVRTHERFHVQPGTTMRHMETNVRRISAACGGVGGLGEVGVLGG